MAKKTRKKNPKNIETLTHNKTKRTYIPTAEYESSMQKDLMPITASYKRNSGILKKEKEMRNQDQDPQLVWRGKDQQDQFDLFVSASPLYIQEKVHPKTLIDDLRNRSIKDEKEKESQCDLFADFNGLPDEGAKTEFYQHDANWSNRMILGDSLQVMASLGEREGLKGKVQCIYLDPPYGIKFNSNFQWDTNNRNVKDGNLDHITREPEQIKAFRDTWEDGISSYLSYLRDRFTVARELLNNSGSIFVQISDENVHRVRAVMDEVFGDSNFISEIVFTKTRSLVASDFVTTICDYILWYSKDKGAAKGKFKKFLVSRVDESLASHYQNEHGLILSKAEYLNQHSNEARVNRNYRPFMSADLNRKPNPKISFLWQGKKVEGRFRTSEQGILRALKADRLLFTKSGVRYKFFLDDFSASPLNHLWADVIGAQDPTYVVQTNSKVVERCILMSTDPGDLVLDPTCGSGTTAYVAEKWGRRWITIDTSRVALALARARIMGAVYPYYLLSDSEEGKLKAAELSHSNPSSNTPGGDIKQGFVNERIPHITLRDIAHNSEIDIIWKKAQEKLEPLRKHLNSLLERNWEEWEIPQDTEETWSSEAKKMHEDWWKAKITRQKEMDASIMAKADFELLYDKPYEDKTKVRVAGPFTVESLSPHRSLGFDENDDQFDSIKDSGESYSEKQRFVEMILENLKTAGVQQAHKEYKINFSSLTYCPGNLICAEGQYSQGEDQGNNLRRAAIFIGPEFGTVSRSNLAAAAREAADRGCDILIACAFNYDARSTEFNTLGSLPILKARMNADLHMAEDLKNTGKGNMFVIFGEPDIDLLDADNDKIQVRINGVDVFHPNSDGIHATGPDGIACWFVDTDYNEQAFLVRHAYFLGTKDPYKSLKRTLKAEINKDAWESLYSNISKPFAKPSSGKIAVKVINHLGDEVMKIYKID